MTALLMPPVEIPHAWRDHPIISRALEHGLTDEQYWEIWEAAGRASLEGLDKEARKMHYYVRYNLERGQTTRAQYAPSEALAEAAARISRPQAWVVITESWCGDSAFGYPVLSRAASLSPHVVLRVLPRDAHLDVMDQYLTGGARSIPKLVVFDEAGAERFVWGARPEEAAQLFRSLAAQGMDKADIIREVIAWYEAGGFRQVDAELAALLAEVVTPA